MPSITDLTQSQQQQLAGLPQSAQDGINKAINSGGSRRGDIWNQYWDSLGQIDQANTQVNNRFDNYSSPFNYQNTSAKLNDLYDLKLNDINKNFSSDVAKGTQDLSGRMASQGVTGGSILNEMLSGVRNNGAIRRDSNINNLDQIFTNADMNAMQMENQNMFQNTNAAQNVDFRNIMSELQKLGLRMNGVNSMNNYLSGWEQSDMQRDAQPGVLDDIFSGIGGLASIASIPLTGGASGVSLGGHLMSML